MIVVENGEQECRDVVQALLTSLRGVYLHSRVANKSAALDVAIDALDEDFALFFDDDVRIDPVVLEGYAAAFRKYGDDFYYGGKCVSEFDTPPQASTLRLFPHSVRGLDYGEQEQIRETPFFVGFNWAAPTAALRAIGGFDPHFGPSATQPTGEETLAQRLLARRGLRGVYLPHCCVYHHVPASHCSMRWLRQRYYRWGMELGSGDERSMIYRMAYSFGRLAKALLFALRSLLTGNGFVGLQWLFLLWDNLRGHWEGRRLRALKGGWK